MPFMWFALLFHNKLLKMGKQSMVFIWHAVDIFLFLFTLSSSCSNKGDRKRPQVKTSFEKNGDSFSNLNIFIFNLNTSDIQTCSTWKQWNTWRKGGEMFHHVPWEIFQNYCLLAPERGSPERSCSITAQRSRRFLHGTNIKKDSN